MPRLPRLIVPDIPHHITQRGNRRQRVFFSDSDKLLYLRILLDNSQQRGMRYLAYCLMDNHVHLIITPRRKEDISIVLGETHRKYSTIINIREKWKGHLWQGRFCSCPLDDIHLSMAVRYIERNPVRAGIVEKAEDFPWSSARAHLALKNDALLDGTPGFLNLGSWREYLVENDNEEFVRALQLHERTGRPFGKDDFINNLETLTGRTLKKKKTGPKGPRSSSKPLARLKI